MEKENPPQYHGVNLYVKNFDSTFDDNSLFAVFSAYGTIISAKIMRHDDGTSKGFGFVCFANDNDAIKAIEELNGSVIANKPIYVALFESKKKRQEKLTSRYAEYERDAAEHHIPWESQPRGRSRGAPRGTTRGRGRFTEPLDQDLAGGRRSLPGLSVDEPVHTGVARARGPVPGYSPEEAVGHKQLASHLSNENMVAPFGANVPLAGHFIDLNAGYEQVGQYMGRRSLPGHFTGESMGRVPMEQYGANEHVRGFLASENLRGFLASENVRGFLANENVGYDHMGLMRGVVGHLPQASSEQYQYRTDNP